MLRAVVFTFAMEYGYVAEILNNLLHYLSISHTLHYPRRSKHKRKSSLHTTKAPSRLRLHHTSRSRRRPPVLPTNNPPRTKSNSAPLNKPPRQVRLLSPCSFFFTPSLITMPPPPHHTHFHALQSSILKTRHSRKLERSRSSVTGREGTGQKARRIPLNSLSR